MNEILLITISLGLMLSLALPRRKLYQISLGKTFLLVVWVAVTGLLGTNILYLIENGTWGGRSFFGAVLFIPLFLVPAAHIFKIHIQKLVDFVAAPGLAMFVVNKLNCYLTGCCGGRVFRHTADGIPVYFPSQFVEMSVAIVIVCISLVLERIEVLRGKIYPICLILYGITRYILNSYRHEQAEFIFGMTAGSFWSVIAVIIGSVWLIISAIRTKKPLCAQNS